MSKRKKKMTLKQMRSLVVFLVAINIILLLCILVMGFFLAKAQITKGKGQTVMLQKANDTYIRHRNRPLDPDAGRFFLPVEMTPCRQNRLQGS